jgi:hypothetical protein
MTFCFDYTKDSHLQSMYYVMGIDLCATFVCVCVYAHTYIHTYIYAYICISVFNAHNMIGIITTISQIQKLVKGHIANKC